MNTNRIELSMNELEQVYGGECNPFDVAKRTHEKISDLPHEAVEVVKKVWNVLFG